MGDYADKQQLQNLIFPEGMYYNRKNDQCRTPRINSVFAYMTALTQFSGKEKTDNKTLISNVAGCVAKSGFEPETSGL